MSKKVSGREVSLRSLPEIEGLRKSWTQQCFWQEEVLRLRDKDNLPPAHLTVRSPYDHHAHDGYKRDLAWFGSKVHFSETCDEDLPHFMTHVVTTDASTTDMEQTLPIHRALNERDLCPAEHLLDAGYVNAESVLQSRERYGIEVIGPISQNSQWQAKAGNGYDLASFPIDWRKQQATCPQGKTSVKWTRVPISMGIPRLPFASVCTVAVNALCTRSAPAPRMLAVRTQAEFEILQHARQHQQTEAFHAKYAQRSGIEGTHSQAASCAAPALLVYPKRFIPPVYGCRHQRDPSGCLFRGKEGGEDAGLTLRRTRSC